MELLRVWVGRLVLLVLQDLTTSHFVVLLLWNLIIFQRNSFFMLATYVWVEISSLGTAAATVVEVEPAAASCRMSFGSILGSVFHGA